MFMLLMFTLIRTNKLLLLLLFPICDLQININVNYILGSTNFSLLLLLLLLLLLFVDHTKAQVGQAIKLQVPALQSWINSGREYRLNPFQGRNLQM